MNRTNLHQFTLTPLIVLICSSLFSTLANAQDLELGESSDSDSPSIQSISIDSDPVVQELLDEYVSARKSRDLEKMNSALERMKVYENNSYSHLVQQLIIFAVRSRGSNEDSDLKTWAPTFVIEQLRISGTDVAYALIPYIHCENEQVRVQVRSLLKVRVRDFSYYNSIIRADIALGVGLRRGLVLFLYELDLEKAILTIPTNNSADRIIVLWAEHQVSDVLWQWRYKFLSKDETTEAARESLIPLVTCKEWWVRLYVAEVMLQYPPFRNEEWDAFLAEDTDELVRKSIEEILKEQAIEESPAS